MWKLTLFCGGPSTAWSYHLNTVWCVSFNNNWANHTFNLNSSKKIRMQNDFFISEKFVLQNIQWRYTFIVLVSKFVSHQTSSFVVKSCSLEDDGGKLAVEFYYNSLSRSWFALSDIKTSSYSNGRRQENTTEPFHINYELCN